MTLRLESCQIDLENRTVWRDDIRVKLTLKESSLLKYLVSRPNEVVDREELYRDVYHYRKGVRTRTLDVAIIRLRKKIERNPHEPAHLLSVYGSGYMFSPINASPKEVKGLAEKASPRSNVPPDWRPFFGRSEELQVLSDLMSSPRKCVTVLGPPGTGKTRLVQQWATELERNDPEALLSFCDLREVTSDKELLNAVAKALGIHISEEESEPEPLGDRLGYAIKSRPKLHLLLDNAEGALEWTAKWVQRWGVSAENARFLVTSQVPLGISMEQRLQLHPLPVSLSSESDEAISPAMALFLDRAQAVKPDFELTSSNRADIQDILDGLDGLPLAIELAAARLHLMSPSEIRARLGQRFKLLKPVSGESDAHQRTLAAAMDSSWELLEPWEKSALAQCAVFNGGFGWEAVEGIVDVSEWSQAPWNLDVVSTLIERSLIKVVEIPQRAVRLEMLETVQAYAEDRAGELNSEVTRNTPKRHARYFSQFGTREFVDALFVQGGFQKLGQLRADLDNLSIALQRSISHSWGPESVRCLKALDALDGSLGMLLPEQELGDRILAQALDKIDRLDVLEVMGRRLLRGAEPRKCGEYLDEAFAIAESLNDVRTMCMIARHRASLGQVLVRHFGEPISVWEKAAENAYTVAKRSGDELCLCGAQIERAALLLGRGHPDAAVKDLQEALKVSKQYQNLMLERHALNLLGIANLEMRQFLLAKDFFSRAVGIAQKFGHDASVARLFHNLSVLCEGCGRTNEGLKYALEAKRIRQRIGDEAGVADTLQVIGDSLRRMGKFKLALDVYEECFAQMERERRFRRVTKVMRSIALNFVDLKETAAAQDYAEKGLLYARQHDSEREILALAVAGEVSLRIGRLPQAAEYLERVEKQWMERFSDGSIPRKWQVFCAHSACLLDVIGALQGEESHPDDTSSAVEAALERLESQDKGELLCLRAEAAAIRGNRQAAEQDLALAELESEKLVIYENSSVARNIKRVQALLETKP